MQGAKEQQHPLGAGKRWSSGSGQKGCAEKQRWRAVVGTGERRFESDGLRMKSAAGMMLLAAVAVFWQTVGAAWIHLHPCPFPRSSSYPSSTEEEKLSGWVPLQSKITFHNDPVDADLYSLLLLFSPLLILQTFLLLPRHNLGKTIIVSVGLRVFQSSHLRMIVNDYHT